MNLRACISVALAMVFSFPATAQRPGDVVTGSRTATRVKPPSPQASANLMAALARCVHQLKGPAAKDFLRHSDPISYDPSRYRDFQQFVRSLDMDFCLGQLTDDLTARATMTADIRTYRSVLAEVGYLMAHARVPALPATATESVARPVFSTGARQQVAQQLQQLSDCIIFRNAAGADALVRTDVLTSAERAAAVALSSALSQCIRAGQEITLTPRTIRALAAEGLWSRFVGDMTLTTTPAR